MKGEESADDATLQEAPPTRRSAGLWTGSGSEGPVVPETGEHGNLQEDRGGDERQRRLLLGDGTAGTTTDAQRAPRAPRPPPGDTWGTPGGHRGHRGHLGDTWRSQGTPGGRLEVTGDTWRSQGTPGGHLGDTGDTWRTQGTLGDAHLVLELLAELQGDGEEHQRVAEPRDHTLHLVDVAHLEAVVVELAHGASSGTEALPGRRHRSQGEGLQRVVLTHQLQRVVLSHQLQRVVLTHQLQKVVLTHQASEGGAHTPGFRRWCSHTRLQKVVLTHQLQKVVLSHQLQRVVLSHQLQRVVLTHQLQKVVLSHQLQRVVLSHQVQVVLTLVVLEGSTWSWYTVRHSLLKLM
ncbi:hypothetical protein EYF80_063778 [Liparis tanakae]|uniref:Uncharacterized protein n=1 Tax=Liparis tanakae TaxID=230148 RepID=A0A4Z2EBF7_9TELE|nr:hypothetical protein EYF80_063778 [Liparis tanakae]